ncbi:MAG: 50S ribosomal protein L9 [Candidatus Jorgensenbacteria bacterium]
MKIVLLHDVKGLGRKEDVKEVKDGYARNFLLPRKLAEPASAAALERVASLEARRAREREKHLTRAAAEAEKLAAIPLQFHARVGEKGELFGSVTAEDIAALLKERGIAEVRGVRTAPLRALGEHAVELDFGEGMKRTVTVTVLPARL